MLIKSKILKKKTNVKLVHNFVSFFRDQVTIEELESKFVPCDITPDMYDTDVDDYTLFLVSFQRQL